MKNGFLLLKKKIACLSFELLETRNKILSLINNELGKIAEPFSSCDIEFIYAYDVANDARIMAKNLFQNIRIN